MRVALEQLRPDMVLEADLTDQNGRLLLAAGTALTEKHLRYCQMWGVTEAAIEGEGAGPSSEPTVDPAAIERALATLEPRFRHPPRDHPLIAALLRHVAHAIAAKGA
jgi:hypothetical protein